MKMNKFAIFIVSMGLGLGMMTGCGGGSSDDGTTVPPAPTAGLEADRVNELAKSLADELGCTYTEITTSQSTVTDIAASLDTVGLIKKVVVSGKSVIAKAEETVIAATEPGTCGGSVTIPDDLLDTMTGTIIFDNYCMTDAETGTNTAINGSLAISGDEATQTISASTPTPITIVSTSPETGNPVNVTLDLDNATYKFNEDESVSITIAALTITDNVANNTYTVTNVTAEVVGDVVTIKGTLNSAEFGVLNMVGSLNDVTGEGSITVTDQDGTEVQLSSTSTEGIFDVSFDDAPLGTMDCSMVAVPTI